MENLVNHKRALQYEIMASRYLSFANQLKEMGNKERSEEYYTKADRAMVLMNKYLGNE